MQIQAKQFISARVPSGMIVTLHTGNTRDVDDADAQWLLAEYPERVVALDAPAAVSADNAPDDETTSKAPKAPKAPKGK